MKKALKILKIIFTLVIITIIIINISFHKLYVTLKHTSIKNVVIAFIIMSIAFMFMVKKWLILLNIQKIKLNFKEGFLLYYTGLFFNLFLPTSLGGDFVRMYYTAKKSYKNRAGAVASVIMERIFGFFTVSLIAIAGILINFLVFKTRIMVKFKIFAVLMFIVAGTMIFILIFLNKYAKKIIAFITPRIFDLKGKITKLNEAIFKYKTYKTFKALSLNILIQLLYILANYFVIKSFSENITFFHCALFIPIIFVVSALPITMGGHGIREGAYIYLFGTVGLTKEQALATSLIIISIFAIHALAGGGIYIYFSHVEDKVEKAENSTNLDIECLKK